MDIDLNAYRAALNDIRLGKRTPSALYCHYECVESLPEPLSTLVERASVVAEHQGFPFDVFKFGLQSPRLSLLRYPEFFDKAFPGLSRSAVFDLNTEGLSIREYPDSDEQPVLHRKELLLPFDHPQLDEYSDLTEVAESLGLFADTSRIGRAGYWNRLLQSLGLEVRGHQLFGADGRPKLPEEGLTEVLRYRTALKRNRLSVPMQMLFKHDLLSPGVTLFDYGCGRGDDLRLLRELDVTASGWDPHFNTDAPRTHADVVNMGYVLNVIEAPEERRGALNEAFALADKLMVVSALTGIARHRGKVRAFGDGVITSTGSFQKYFEPDELAALVEQVLGVSPISVASGVLLCFKDEAAEQEFLARRIARRRVGLIRIPIQNLDELDEDLRRQAEVYWEQCTERGRAVSYDELAGCTELKKKVPNQKRLFDIVAREQDDAGFKAAAQARKNALLVEFALAEFGKRLFFKYFPKSLQLDIRHHFGGYGALKEESKALLFSLGNTELIAGDCVDATDDGIGFLKDDHSLSLHASLLTKLSPRLRVYVGCAQTLYGSTERVDLIKIHIASGKISFMIYDDFEGRPVPDLIERAKVKLWEREIDFFDYIGQFTPQPLFLKSLYLSEDSDIYKEQEAFDGALMKTKLFDFLRDPPSRDVFYQSLRGSGYRIQGYELQQTA